jgi:hypothetical protein
VRALKTVSGSVREMIMPSFRLLSFSSRAYIYNTELGVTCENCHSEERKTHIRLRNDQLLRSGQKPLSGPETSDEES